MKEMILEARELPPIIIRVDGEVFKELIIKEMSAFKYRKLIKLARKMEKLANDGKDEERLLDIMMEISMLVAGKQMTKDELEFCMTPLMVSRLIEYQIKANAIEEIEKKTSE